MFENFMTGETLTTFSGLTTAVIVIVQFTKFIVKRKFGDHFVRPYAFFISLLLTYFFAEKGNGLEGIFITILNSMMIAISSMGGYELIADPMARKVRL